LGDDVNIESISFDGGSTQEKRAGFANSETYRPDIDGLRAIAVLSVLFFHVGLSSFSGGYIGVDVFFVISGYLICSLVVRDLERGQFSILSFYGRRARRIFPALFLMIGAVIIVGGVTLLPIDYRRLGTSTVATTLFVGNLYFASHSGYFGLNAEEAPLLHTWSLAVEEQFYILLPLLALVTYRFLGRRYNLVFGTVALLSFISSLLMLKFMPVSAFYFPSARAWELLTGGLLAMGAFPAATSALNRTITGLLGLALIAWGVFQFSEMTRFPGGNALFPVLGSMLLIRSGGHGGSIANRLLGWAPLNFVGRISYSLYLWHWPIIVFWKYRTDGYWEPWEQAVVISLSLTIAILSWRYVEQPFRRLRSIRPRRGVAYAILTLVVGCSAGALLFSSDGMPSRMPTRVVALDQATNSMAVLPGACEGVKPMRRGELCTLGASDGRPPAFLLWGDSHAHAMMPAFDRAGRQLGLAGRIASYPACPSLLGVDRLDYPPSHDCSEYNRLVLEELREMPSVTTVFLVSRWGLCINKLRSEGGRPCYLGRSPQQPATFAATQLLFRQGLVDTVATLTGMGKRVVLVASVPEFHRNVPEALARATYFGETAGLDVSTADYLSRQRAVFGLFDMLHARYGARILYPHEVLCRTGRCQLIEHGVPLYADDDHLSETGALKLTSLVLAAMKEAESRKPL
jgi:peptidoglycan/LPS O-acetylase OafA/YrhL